MQELLQAAISANNIVYTTLLIVVLLYWFTVIIGAFDINSFDIDLDSDVDIDLDTDGEIHASGWFMNTLQFFNFGKIPFMVLLTFLILFTWSGSILANHYLGNETLFFAIAILIPNVFLGLLLTKLITLPLISVFKDVNSDEEKVDYIGMSCEVIYDANFNKMGQAEVVFKNSTLRINIKTNEKNRTISRGQRAFIIDRIDDHFIIKKSN